jgi:hypothetical protein
MLLTEEKLIKKSTHFATQILTEITHSSSTSDPATFLKNKQSKSAIYGFQFSATIDL